MKIAGNLISDIERDSSCPSRFAGTCARAPAPSTRGQEFLRKPDPFDGNCGTTTKQFPGILRRCKKSCRTKLLTSKGWPSNHREDETNSVFVFTSLFPQDLSLLQVKQPWSSQDGKQRIPTAAMAVGKSFLKKSRIFLILNLKN